MHTLRPLESLLFVRRQQRRGAEQLLATAESAMVSAERAAHDAARHRDSYAETLRAARARVPSSHELAGWLAWLGRLEGELATRRERASRAQEALTRLQLHREEARSSLRSAVAALRALERLMAHRRDVALRRQLGSDDAPDGSGDGSGRFASSE